MRSFGRNMLEFVGLGPKMYSYTVDRGKVVKKAQGLKNV